MEEYQLVEDPQVSGEKAMASPRVRSQESRKSQEVVGMIGETRVTRVTKPVATISPPKMPVKEQWEVKSSPKGKVGGLVKETEELWLCPREDCSYMGATAAKMRLHLSCHGLDSDEVESWRSKGDPGQRASLKSFRRGCREPRGMGLPGASTLLSTVLSSANSSWSFSSTSSVGHLLKQAVVRMR